MADACRGAGDGTQGPPLTRETLAERCPGFWMPATAGPSTTGSRRRGSSCRSLTRLQRDLRRLAALDIDRDRPGRLLSEPGFGRPVRM